VSGGLSAVAVRPDRPLGPTELLRAMFDAALDAADPGLQVPRALGESWWTTGRTVVLGAGKAAAVMARAV
jgi:glycerate 2-kinase